eukprot:13660732-Ditylum_brightwellii.AAC.1
MGCHTMDVHSSVGSVVFICGRKTVPSTMYSTPSLFKNYHLGTLSSYQTSSGISTSQNLILRRILRAGDMPLYLFPLIWKGLTLIEQKLWAKEHGTYVFKWRNKTRQHINAPTPVEMDEIYESNSFFWQFWVHKAPSNLSHNINDELALVNGTPLLNHSMAFEDESEFDCLLDWLEGPDAPPFGTKIE